MVIIGVDYHPSFQQIAWVTAGYSHQQKHRRSFGLQEGPRLNAKPCSIMGRVDVVLPANLDSQGLVF